MDQLSQHESLLQSVGESYAIPILIINILTLSAQGFKSAVGQGRVLDTDTKDLGWMIESLVIDPFDSDHWLYATGLTVFGGHDLTEWDTTHNITIQVLADGIEEFAVLGLASAPGGSELLAAVGDDSGFTFASSSALQTSPQNHGWTPYSRHPQVSTTPALP